MSPVTTTLLTNTTFAVVRHTTGSQPSLPSALPSSHSSSPIHTTLSPHVACAQVDRHASVSTALPSSHASLPAHTTPSPHVALLHSLRHVSSSAMLPSSHSSPGFCTPSPHAPGGMVVLPSVSGLSVVSLVVTPPSSVVGGVVIVVIVVIVVVVVGGVVVRSPPVVSPPSVAPPDACGSTKTGFTSRHPAARTSDSPR